MAEPAKIVTGIGNAELHRILVRGYDLNKELVGKITFTDMTSLILRGRLPTANEAKMIDALLIILVEHGMVSHVVAARLIYHCAPEAMQARGGGGAMRRRQRASRIFGMVGENARRRAPGGRRESRFRCHRGIDHRRL